MALLKCVLLLAFMMSVCEAAALPSCIWTHFRLKALNERSTGLLESMGDRMPLECLEGKNNHSFPKDVFIKAQNGDVFLVALETLKGVVTIFESNHTSVTWNSTKLRTFKSIVKRQVENLQKCVGEKVREVTDKPADSSTDALRSYFTKLEERLEEKEFSSCAWEVVRSEIQDGLEKLQAFIESKK